MSDPSNKGDKGDEGKKVKYAADISAFSKESDMPKSKPEETGKLKEADKPQSKDPSYIQMSGVNIDFIIGMFLTEHLTKILSLNQAEKRDEVDRELLEYQKKLEALIQMKDPSASLTTQQAKVEETKVEESKGEEPKGEAEEEYYASGCVLNFHLRCVKHLNSNEGIDKLIEEAKQMINQYGSKLIPHELYRLHKEVPTQKARDIDASIRQKWASEDPHKSFLAKRLGDALARDGIELLLTDQKPPKERDCSSVLISGGHKKRLIKVTLKDRDENDFEKMAKDKEFAATIYREVRQAIIKSGKFKVTKESDIKILAFECNSPPTAFCLSTFEDNQFGPLSLNVTNAEISSVSVLEYVNLNKDEFSNNVQGGATGDESGESSGGQPFFLCDDWEGYNINQ